MIPEKVINFIGSDDFYKIIEEIGKNFFNCDWQNPKMPLLIAFVSEVLTTNTKGDALIKLAKEFLNFLNEDELSKFLNYFEENYRSRINELWQQEIEEPIEKFEEPYEEREKRYLELMKEIVKKPLQEQSNKEQSNKKVISLTKEEFKEKTKKMEIFNEELDKKKESTHFEENKDKETKIITYNPEDSKIIPEKVFSWQGEDNQTEKVEFPENVIVIKKIEENKKNKPDNILDLSNL